MKQIDNIQFSILDFFLGEIPNHWQMNIKLSSIARNSRGSFTNGPFGSDLLTSELQDTGVPVIYIRDIRNGVYQRVSDAFVTPQKAKQLNVCNVTEGDILVAKVGDPPGISAIYPPNEPNAIITQDVIRIKTQKRIVNNVFLVFLLNSQFGKYLIDQITVESTRSRISLGDFKRINIFLPPLSEQTEIATYLDRKTYAIDRKVALLEQKIAHYQQLLKSLINETVCRGLDKNVKLKDSGIEWIGRIPDHWEVKRVKDVCGFVNRGSSPNYDENGSYKVVNQATFSKGFWDESSLRFTQNFEVKPRGLLKEDDILIASTGGGVLGKVYFFNRKESDYIADSHITILRDTRKSYVSKYVFYYFSEKFKLINDILAQGSTNQTELQKDWILAFFICIPPQIEQADIANYLGEKTQKIDSIISNIKTQIETLKELRKTLINDVITGKIKVTD